MYATTAERLTAGDPALPASVRRLGSGLKALEQPGVDLADLAGRAEP